MAIICLIFGCQLSVDSKVEFALGADYVDDHSAQPKYESTTEYSRRERENIPMGT